MSKDSDLSLNQRIEAVERRLERRRHHLSDESHEAAAAASETLSRVVPVAATLVAGLAGFWLATRLTGRRRYQRREEPAPAEARRGLRWASLAGIVASAIRIGRSREARLVWEAIRSRKRARPV